MDNTKDYESFNLGSNPSVTTSMKGRFNIDIEQMKKDLFEQGQKDRSLFAANTWTCVCGCSGNRVGSDCRVCGQDRYSVPK